MAPQIGSVLLASANPKQLRDWYVEAFAPEVDKTPDGAYDVLNFGGFYVMIDSRDDVGERNPEPGRLIVNVEVDDARAVAAKLDGMSTAWLAELEDRDGSLFATAIDPDGNYVQIIELSEAHRAAMG